MTTTANHSNFKEEDIVRIKAISKKFDVEILEALGVDSFSDRGVQGCCPVHGGDNPTAFCYDTSKKIWSCFTQHCQKQYGNDIIGLIRSLKEFSFSEAVTWIDEKIGINNDIKIEDIYSSISIEEYMHQKPAVNETIPESKLENLSKDCSSLSGRNFKKETFEHFSVGLCESSKIIHQRVMIPIRDADGMIVGFTGRSIHDLNASTGGYHPPSFSPQNNSGRFFSKWRTYPKNFNKSVELYNFHEAKAHIQKSNTCFIVEGPFDLWRMWEMGAKNCVSTLGTGLTKYQSDKLISADCINLYILYDSDKAGKEAAEKISERFNSDFHVYNITLPENTDPASMSQDFFDLKIRPLL